MRISNPSSPQTALGGEVDAWDPRAEGISLLTLHASKGLEFPVVFLAGCEDGLLPLTFPGAETDLAEERRLFFVGITRARSRLFLFHSRRRTLARRDRSRRGPPPSWRTWRRRSSIGETSRSSHRGAPSSSGCCDFC